jgi:hypothetical protein
MVLTTTDRHHVLTVVTHCLAADLTPRVGGPEVTLAGWPQMMSI